MTEPARVPSARESELLERAYGYVLEHGLAGLSLRPLAAAIGSSPRVLLFLVGSKDGLVRALLARARAEELAFLDRARAGQTARSPAGARSPGGDHSPAGAGSASGYHSPDGAGFAGRSGLAELVRLTWQWLAAPQHRPLLTLWAEAYARSLTEPDGPWAGFGRETVADWLALLAEAQPPARRDSAAGAAERALALSVLRGALLDLLATGDTGRLTGAVEHYLRVTDRLYRCHLRISIIHSGVLQSNSPPQ